MVYYNPKSLANILSLSKIDTIYQEMYNSDVAKAFIVHGTTSGDKKFIKRSGGLHYYDPSVSKERFVMMQTVSNNKSKIMKKDAISPVVIPQLIK